MYKYFKTDSIYYILSWISKGLSSESITPLTAPNDFLLLH